MLCDHVTHYPSIGSVSEGTLRTGDLVSAFADALAQCIKRHPRLVSTPTRKAHRKLVAECSAFDPDAEESDGFVDELFDALNDYAAPGLFFGASESDGASFGFWPLDIDDDMARVDDSAKLDALPADVSEACIVSDHGNVTFCVRTRSGWAIVWDCV